MPHELEIYFLADSTRKRTKQRTQQKPHLAWSTRLLVHHQVSPLVKRHFTLLTLEPTNVVVNEFVYCKGTLCFKRLPASVFIAHKTTLQKVKFHSWFWDADQDYFVGSGWNTDWRVELYCESVKERFSRWILNTGAHFEIVIYKGTKVKSGSVCRARKDCNTLSPPADLFAELERFEWRSNPSFHLLRASSSNLRVVRFSKSRTLA